MGERKMTAALELLMVIVILISGFSAADDDVVAETDEMARRIEEESKKVDEKTNDMVSAIEAKGKIIEDANQDNRFKEASKHVDDIMDKSEEAVDDKADFAEELENEADRKVEELSRKVEEVSNRDNNKGITRKRSTPVIMGLEPKQDIMASSHVKEKEKTEDLTGKAKDKIEPSKVVVLPDVAIRGTDYNNMQIKELKSQKSHGIWLAVHIPDNATAFRPVKILSTKKAADDLEKVIGPNRETMFKELQTIIGVDGATLRKMLKSGQIDSRKNRKMHKDKEEEEEEMDDEESVGESDKDEEDEEEDEKEEEEEDDSGDDKKCDDEEDEDEEESDDEEEDEDEEEDDKHPRKHKDKKLNKLKSQSKQMDKPSTEASKKPKLATKCSRKKVLPWTLDDGGGSGAETNSSAVLQPQGYTAPLANVLNKIHVHLKTKKACKNAKNPIIKELCKQMNRHHEHPRPNFNQPRRHHLAHIKYYKHLRKLMRKFLNRHSGKQAKQVLQYMNLLLSDQLRLSNDGIVHLYPNRGEKINNYGDGFKALADDESGKIGRGQGNPPLEPPIIDDNMYNGHVIRVPVPGSTRGTPPNIGIMSNSQANVMNNQVHTKLGDTHSEGDTQVQMLREELGRSNDELREQQKERTRDESIMDKYMFNFQSLAEKGPVNTFNGMQKDAEERVNGQQVSVIDPNQVTLKQSRLPIRNRVDVPSLGGFVGEQFAGLSRRNNIGNYLKNIALKQIQHQHKRISRKKLFKISHV